MGRFKNLFFAVLLLAFSNAHADFLPSGESMPLPWPFPWAKDCHIDWDSLSGRYKLSDSATDSDYIDLQVTVITREGFHLVSVAHYSANSELLSEGFALISDSQRSLRLPLMPAEDTGGDSFMAVIQMHYPSGDLRCAADQLVPILTMESMDPKNHQVIHFRLFRWNK